MLIQVVRTGGFAGIERRGEVDTASRPDAHEWHALAAAAVAAGQGLRLPGAAIPDGFSYEITVDGRTTHCAEPQLSDAQRDLISRVLKEGA